MKISMYKPTADKKEISWPPMKMVHIDFEQKDLDDTFLVRYNYVAGQFEWLALSEIEPGNLEGSEAWSCLDGGWGQFLDLDTPEMCKKYLKDAPKLMAALGKCF